MTQPNATTPRWGDSVLLASLLLYGAAIVFFQNWGRLGLAAPLWLLAFLPPLGTRLRSVVGLLAILTTGAALPMSVWPAHWVVLLAGLALYYRALAPETRPEPGWWARGAFTPLLIALIALTSGIALYLWWWWAAPDLSAHRALLPDVDWPWLVLAGLAFSMANAFVEEVLFRGLLQSFLLRAFAGLFGSRSATTHRALAVVGSAFAFGIAHWSGFPSGASGAALAGIYGLMLGALRERSGGLLSPWVAHIAADAVIFAILASVAL